MPKSAEINAPRTYGRRTRAQKADAVSWSTAYIDEIDCARNATVLLEIYFIDTITSVSSITYANYYVASFGR